MLISGIDRRGVLNYELVFIQILTQKHSMISNLIFIIKIFTDSDLTLH